jgi:hypothetical protein
MIPFWDIAQYSLVEVDRRFRGAYCLHHQADESLMIEAVRAFETSVYFNGAICQKIIFYEKSWEGLIV